MSNLDVNEKWCPTCGSANFKRSEDLPHTYTLKAEAAVSCKAVVSVYWSTHSHMKTLRVYTPTLSWLVETLCEDKDNDATDTGRSYMFLCLKNFASDYV
jgi:hypothetical protein